VKRASLAGTVLVAALAVALPAVATESGNYRDQFKNPSYSGNDGSLSWSGPWQEVGESDGVNLGSVHITPDSHCAGNQCLHIYSPGLQFSEIGAERYADTSVFEEAELCYYLSSYVLEGFELLSTSVEVQLTSDGWGWMTIETVEIIDLWDDGHERTFQLDPEYLSEDFGIRFVVSGLLGGEVFIDDVEVSGDFEPEPTTTTQPTTTTKPAPTTTKPRPEPADRPDPTTTTTAPATTSSTSSTTTTVPATVAVPSPPPPGPGAGPTQGGLRMASLGIQSDHTARPFEDGGLVTPEVLALTVDYGMAVEVIAANWIWTVLLVLIVTAAWVQGFDRRRARRPESEGSGSA
jgi:hypothetical protein